jgi:hypothetical protein
MQTMSSSKLADSLRLSPRLLAMLANVARYGVLTSDQIARLDGGSRQKVTRHLQYTVEAKLLRRVDRGPELFLTAFFDARPRAFAVTPKGLRALEAAGICMPVSPKRADVLIAHEVETAEAMFSIAASVAANPDLRLIDQPELIAMMPLQTRESRRPLRLQPLVQPRDFPSVRHLFTQPTAVGVEPDRLLVIARRHADGWSGIFGGIELDRGGEPITTKRLRGRPTWARKTIGYVAAWSEGLHVRQWGEMCKAFRVLVITPSRDRARNIIELQQKIGAPPGLFLFTSLHALRERGALSPIWMSAKSDSVSLLD